MQRFWPVAALVALSAPALAHDFWMQPADFILDKPGPAAISMFVGHGAARDRWKVGNDHIVQFNSIGPDGLVKRDSTLRLNGGAFDAIVPLRQEGAYVIALQSKTTLSSLPAKRFNDYIDVEGITPIQTARRKAGDQNADGRESYSRRAKTIVQVGPVDEASIRQVTSPVNLKLEIVPLRHPQALAEGSIMPVQVLFQGKPLAGAFVKLTDLASDEKPVATARTNGAGKANFRIARAGKWQMNVVWSEPLRNNSDADFLTTFSSLSFQTLK